MRLVTVLILLFPTLSQADPYGTEARMMIYQQHRLDASSNLLRDLFQPQSEVTVHILPLSDGEYLEIRCNKGQVTDCQANHFIDFIRTAAKGQATPSDPIEKIMSQLEPIRIYQVEGEPLLPLVDGAKSQWLEHWKLDGETEFEAEYQMTASVYCCRKLPFSTLNGEDRFWAIEYVWENSGRIGTPEGGIKLIYYDPDRKLITMELGSKWWRDETDISTFMHFLKSTERY